MSKPNLLTLTLVLVSFAIGSPEARADYDPAVDFSSTSNPSGPWSYGWSQTLGGTFNLDAIHVHDNTTGLDVWDGSVVSPLGNFPIVAHNGTAQTISYSTVTYSPGQLGLHPGPAGEYSLVRFIAPSSGQYSISGGFVGLDFVGPTTTDVHILQNSSAIFNGVVNSYGSGPSFSTVLTLQAGDKLDFAVGFGSNGSYFYDSTGLAVHISAVPEPATIAMGIIGAIGLIAVRRRYTPS
jgi:hypothetical protein